MKKYIFILKTELMSNLQYVFNTFIGFITYFIILFTFFNLWQYIYSDPSEIINGYTMNQMIWYVVITEVLWSTINGKGLCRKISNDVKSGNIAYNMNKPYNYILYSLFSHLGACSLRGFIYIVMGMFTGFMFLGSFPSLNIFSIITVLISIILATTINTLLIIFIGLFSFVIEDAQPFYWLYSKLILVVGVLFPIEYFPKVIQPFLNMSPVYAVSYGPAKLFVDFSLTKFIEIFIVQLIYLIIAYLLCHLIYKKGVKKLNVNGG